MGAVLNGVIRFPRPSYLFARLTPRRGPDAVLFQVLTCVAEMHQLGEIRTCWRAPRSNSMNFFVTTSQGKFVLRRHNLAAEAVEYEHQVLEYLNQRGFPAPRMCLNSAGQPWSRLDGSLYSVYSFTEGYFPTDFLWLPATRREIIAQCGRTLGEYHRAISGLIPDCYKWNGYRPTEHKRWREGDWFRQVLAEIRPFLQKSIATRPMDDFVRSRIDVLERMLELESVVEGRSDLSKLVIHGDYAPWNVLFRKGSPPLVLDFNESRLDLKIYDVALATFWFAWRDGRLDRDRALTFQSGYRETDHLREADIDLAGSVFQWIMARSLTERLHLHYLQHDPLCDRPAGMERQIQMCFFADRYPQQLVAGLKERVRQ